MLYSAFSSVREKVLNVDVTEEKMKGEGVIRETEHNDRKVERPLGVMEGELIRRERQESS